MPENTLNMNQDARGIMAELLKNSLNTLKKVDTAHIQEAAQQGVPTENILQTLLQKYPQNGGQKTSQPTPPMSMESQQPPVQQQPQQIQQQASIPQPQSQQAPSAQQNIQAYQNTIHQQQPQMNSIQQQAQGLVQQPKGLLGKFASGWSQQYRTGELDNLKKAQSLQNGGVDITPEQQMAALLRTKQLMEQQGINGSFGVTATGVPTIQVGESEFIEGGNLSDEQKLQGMSLSRKLYGVRGMSKGLPSIYKELSNGKTIEQVEDSLRFSGQSQAMSGDFRNAAQTILMNTSEAISQKALDYIDDNLSNGDIEGAKTQLKRLARKEAGVEESRAISGKERTVGLIDEIQNDLKVLEDNGFNTNIFSGTAEQVAGKLGTVKNPELRKIASKIALAIQSYRRSMSGAAFSIPESKEYASVFPSISKTSNFNSAQIQAIKDVFSGDLDSFYSLSMGDKEYKNLFKAEESNNSFSNLSDEELNAKIKELEGKK